MRRIIVLLSMQYATFFRELYHLSGEIWQVVHFGIKPCRRLAFLCLFVLADHTKKPLKHSFKGFGLGFDSYCRDLGAEDEAQTRDPQLGRLMLYQLSYFRLCCVGEDGFEPPKTYVSRFTVCPIWPLWYSPWICSALQLLAVTFGFEAGQK